MIAVAPSHPAQLQNYTSWLEKRGFSYRLLKERDNVDGYSVLLLCGGPDVGSAGKRDILERDWFRAAYGKIPVLGICRGLQLCNLVLGGTLHEDLSDEVVKHSSNRVDIAGEPKPLLESSWHDVELIDGRKIRVNSRHHQGIKDLAPGLSVLATCEDGIIEMAEGDMSLFVQWHPERSDVWGTEAETIVYEWLKRHCSTSSPSDKIFSYMKSKGFTVISNDRVRKSIDSSYDDDFLRMLILENALTMKRVTDKFGRLAIKMI